MPHFLLLFLCLVLTCGVSVAAPDAFVDEARCAQCHSSVSSEWQQSHHARSMLPASDATVLGDFNDVVFRDAGVESRFFRRGGEFFVHTQGGDGQYADFRVKYTFGFTPLQQYLLELPKGRLQAFTVTWDSLKKRWFSLYPGEKIAPNDPLHWSGRRFTWNSSCAECHSTDIRLNYDAETASYRTSWAVINVGCQACHGPAGGHLAWVDDPARPAKANKGWAVDLKTLSGPEQVESCAACHARRYSITLDDLPNRPLLDDFLPELLREGLYHPDGQMQDEVFNYGSFLQAKMYRKGIGCLDCHQPHTLQTRRPGDALCTGCHQPRPPRLQGKGMPRAKVYDAPSHHFHKVDSAGARCMNCHAPPQNYMVVDPRHDHGFRIPRPDLSIKLGVPNACTQCHADQSANWALAKMRDWYGTAWQVPHYGEILAMGRTGVPEALPGLSTLAHDRQQPAIVRATALDLLRRQGAAGQTVHASLLHDPEPLVRLQAAQGLENPDDPKRLAALPTLLHDPLRAVRLEAARVLALTPGVALTTKDQAALTAVLEEYRTAQRAADDQPEGQANLGVLYAAMKQPEAAERAYRAALARDPDFVPAYANLASLYYATGRRAEAERAFRDALRQSAGEPLQARLRYSLALLLAEQSRLVEAAEQMQQAVALTPGDARMHYNHGLLLQTLGRYPGAETALLRAAELSPRDPDFLYGLVSYYVAQKRPNDAYPFAERLRNAYPDRKEFGRLADSLRPGSGQ